MSDLDISDNPLTTLKADIRRHWSKYLPGMTKRLAEAGILEERIESAAAQTTEAVLSYVETAKGSTFTPAQAFWQAWEIYRNEWAFLPAEVSEEEEEEEDPNSFSAQMAERRAAISDLYEEYYAMRGWREKGETSHNPEEAEND